MKYLLLLILSIASTAFGLELTNPITADGTYTVKTHPGQRYVFSAAGDFGSGSLAIQWNDGTTATAFSQSPATAAETWTFTAPSNQVDLVLSGSSGASITANVTLASGAVDNAAVNDAIAEAPAASQAAIELVPSANGGAGNVLQYDSDGNLRLGSYKTDTDGASGTSTLTGYNGNLLVADDKFVGWLASDNAGAGNYGFGHLGKIYAAIRYDRSHDGTGGEWNFDAQNRVCWYWNRGYQMGSALGGTHYIYFHSGSASAGTTTRQSPPIKLWTSTYSGGVATLNQMGIQARPLDVSGTNSEIAVYRNMEEDPGVQDQDSTDAVKIASFAEAGVWSNGTAPVFEILTDQATITQTCSKWRTVQAAKVTLSSASRTLAVSGAESGMRGVIYVKQSGSGSYGLTLPANSAKASGFALSTTPGQTDRLSWEYDGSFFFWTIANGLEVPLDADVSAFVDAGRANISDATQRDALNNLVASMKGSDVAGTGTLWSKASVLYPFVGGTSTAHAKNLKSTSYDITWSGSPTHNANGVTGDDTAAYGNTGFNMAVLSQNSAGLYVYCRTTTPATTGKFLFGAHQGSTSRTGMLANTVSGNLDYSLNAAGDSSVGAANDFSNHFAINRSGASALELYVGATKSTATTASVAPWTGNIYLLARNNNGSPAGYTSANLAFFAAFSSLTEAEWTAWRAIVDTYQTALGRAN